MFPCPRIRRSPFARGVAALTIALASIASCGGRTPLLGDEATALPSSDGGTDTTSHPIDAPSDAPVDASHAEAGCGDCDDHVDCTHDTCKTETATCAHVPDDRLCPPGLLCHGNGCGVFAYAMSNNAFLDVTLPTGTLQTLGPNPEYLADIALHPNGTLFGVSSNGIYTIDRTTGMTTRGSMWVPTDPNGLDCAPDGTMYASNRDGIYRLGTPNDLVATFPGGWRSSGDLALVSGQIYVSVTQGLGQGNDSLVHVGGGGIASLVGDIGYRCVYGLAAFGPVLYGFTCEGRILNINLTTGIGTEIARTSASFNGATAR